MALNPGTAEQLADRLRQLAAYGDSKHPPADSALAQGVSDARAYADHLENDIAPVDGGVVIAATTDVFKTADGLAQLIIDEGTSGAYGDDSPPPPEAKPWWWWASAAAAVAVGAWAVFREMHHKPRRVTRRRRRRRRALRARTA